MMGGSSLEVVEWNEYMLDASEELLELGGSMLIKEET